MRRGSYVKNKRVMAAEAALVCRVCARAFRRPEVSPRDLCLGRGIWKVLPSGSLFPHPAVLQTRGFFPPAEFLFSGWELASLATAQR